MTIEELDLETTECLPSREVMSCMSRPRGGNGGRYWEHTDNSYNGNGILNGNTVTVGDVNVGNVVGNGNGNVFGNIFESGGGWY
jgi:hypothetical protein